MKRYNLACTAAILSLSLLGCDQLGSSPAYVGTLAETRGKCWTMRLDPPRGKVDECVAGGAPRAQCVQSTPSERVAVWHTDGERLGLVAGRRYGLQAKVSSTQDCRAAVRLDVESAEPVQ